MSRAMYLRVVTCDNSRECYEKTAGAFNLLFSGLEAKDVHIETMAPYHKIDGHGEMGISFFLEDEAALKAILSDKWEGDVTDSRWANIFCPQIAFMWLTAASS